MSASDGVTAMRVSAYRVPTDFSESDGTLEWDSTTMILVELDAQGQTGTGYAYADACVADFISRNLQPLIIGQGPMHIPRLWLSMMKAIRNNGTTGLACMAVSAVDNALWDLKAKLLGLSLGDLLGSVRDTAKLYGSGGFTSYPMERLRSQLSGWVDAGFKAVKIKIGRDWQADRQRIKAAKEITGDSAELMVDANGAYDPKTAVERSEFLADMGVTWFEEPVGSDNLNGLSFIRDHMLPGIRVAAGEYGDQLAYFKQMLDRKAVDILQADATRCCGITGFLKAGILAEADHMPFSFHCAPALHLYPSLALNSFYIGEYFHDHVRIESMFFDDVPQPVNGELKPDLSRPGLGLIFKHQDAKPYRIS